MLHKIHRFRFQPCKLTKLKAEEWLCNVSHLESIKGSKPFLRFFFTISLSLSTLSSEVVEKCQRIQSMFVFVWFRACLCMTQPKNLRYFFDHLLCCTHTHRLQVKLKRSLYVAYVRRRKERIDEKKNWKKETFTFQRCNCCFKANIS